MIEFIKRKTKDKQIGVRITSELHKQITKVAKANKVSFSEATSALIRSALKNIK